MIMHKEIDDKVNMAENDFWGIEKNTNRGLWNA